MQGRWPSHVWVSVLVVSLLACAERSGAQGGGGDQVLDGIGETALVARYVFNGNTEDRSRNSFHATLHGAGAYVDDSQFGKVLSLPGGDTGGYVQIPGQALLGVDALSVTGWIFVRSEAPWQRFFDFGQDTTRNFFCTPIGENESEGYRARITATGWTNELGPASPRIALNRWVHLAVVLDPAKKTLTSYVDGVKAGAVTDVDVTLEQVLNQNSGADNLLYIGKSSYDTDADLDGKLHDVRIYSIALTDKQVATIHRNALSGEDKTEAETSTTPAAGVASSQASRLTGVPDIIAETAVGTLPHLPYYVPGVYRDGTQGPLVRVIWPSPTDNNQVRELGTYVVTGTVVGTSFQPKATVSVKTAPETAAERSPQRVLEPFPLGQVVLNKDESGRDTQFIKNRDKFILTLAKTDPNSFLYNFRDAFGQPQPQGVRPLGVWDSQTTRLRGHASGHYLSAIAQAYASTTYDEKLHANFLQKMNYMIDTLYDLSRKSGTPAKEGGECNADPTAVPTIGTGARASSALTRRTSSSCWRTAPPTADETTRSGPPTTRCTRSWPACSTATRSAATRRPCKSPRAWASGSMHACRSCRRRPASRCGTATSPASTAA
jgi:hypothetical protein